MKLRNKILNAYGEVVRIILAPAFAPLFREIIKQQKAIAESMLDYNHYYVDDNGFVKEKEQLNQDNEE